jgi:hypothetical protein
VKGSAATQDRNGSDEGVVAFVLLFFLALSVSGSFFLLRKMLVSGVEECCKHSLLSEFEVEADDGPPLGELAAAAPLPMVRSAIWRGRSCDGFLLGVVEKGLERGPALTGYPSEALPSGRLFFYF